MKFYCVTIKVSFTYFYKNNFLHFTLKVFRLKLSHCKRIFTGLPFDFGTQLSSKLGFQFVFAFFSPQIPSFLEKLLWQIWKFVLEIIHKFTICNLIICLVLLSNFLVAIVAYSFISKSFSDPTKKCSVTIKRKFLSNTVKSLANFLFPKMKKIS